MRAALLPASDGAALEIAGLAVAERTRRALARAGFELVGPEGAASGVPRLFIAADAVIEPTALIALARAATADDGAMSAENPIDAPAALMLPAHGGAAPANADDLGRVAAQLRERGQLRLAATGTALCQRVRTPSDAERLDRLLRSSLVKPSDGFFARHFDRKISSRLSPWLVRLGVTPNAITGVATAVGLAGAGCLATQSRGLHVLGAILFILSTILDGCDGEVARLSFMSSEFGRRLDLIGDNVVNAAIFLAIGWSALHADTGHTMSTLVGVTLGGFVLATLAGYAFSRWIDRSGREAEFHDWYESLASRDFAYFVLLLAALGRLHWFVWFAAIGSYSFVGVLAVIRLRAGRGPAPPAPPVSERQWA